MGFLGCSVWFIGGFWSLKFLSPNIACVNLTFKSIDFLPVLLSIGRTLIED